MQAIIIQQDAISELYIAVVGHKWAAKGGSAWQELRDKRNLCAGHPANRRAGKQKTFMGRRFGSHDQITYELYDAHTKAITHSSFDLRKMIDKYDTEAGHVLGSILGAMCEKWP
ncbi:hypothetical protein [uncultured Bradyrhizobium sp.]|uniref:hypothetical protein n=1 Tax=uncultured Bradyrhizobium sp. TaxID=199684 RepID=UPI00262999C3|nr:hypothetical protein [uncultured Bradyrhizobium sp.]